ncbi:MAG TPA: CBS domain-containing protein [Candidatus Altiarchaeales archaeon]|nr:CBS domain-containing protein [Candidatus Altiarchaeales archaeon]
MSARIGKSDIGKTMDRGPREFKSRVVEKEGNVMVVAQKDVVTTHPMNSIRNVAGLMEKHDFRRIPVTDAGTNRLEGMAVAIDIIDFLGGGEKYNIIEKDYGGNFLSAINCPIAKIMKEEYPFLDKRSSVDDVIDIMINYRSSAIPIVENEDTKRVIGIVTERDILPIADRFGITVEESMQEKCITSSPGMMISDVSKIMVRNRIRRLPVIIDDEIVGIVTVFDILRFLEFGRFEGIDAEEILTNTKVEDIMEKDVTTVRSEQDLAEIPKLVENTNLGGFPVVRNNNIVGIVTISDVIREIYRKG